MSGPAATLLWDGASTPATWIKSLTTGQAYAGLGIQPQAGRLLNPSDDIPGAPFVVVISDAFWNSEFHRDPSVIGRTIYLNRRPFTVIGVTPREFQSVAAGEDPSVTISIHADAAIHPEWKLLQSKTSWFLPIYARLKPGVTIDQGRAELQAISASVMRRQEDPTSRPDRLRQFRAQKLDLFPSLAGHSWRAQQYRAPLLILMRISGLILFIACLNLASLLLSRSEARQKELSVRLALGSNRARLIRQLLTESLVLSAGGAALGAVFAFWATHALVAFLSTEGAALSLDLHPDWRVSGFLALLAVATGILFGIFPALQGTNLHPHDALKQSRIGRVRGAARFPLGRLVVSAQIALSLLLIASALLFVRTLQNLKWQNNGFERANLVFIPLDPAENALPDRQRGRFYYDLLDSVRHLPFVRAATLTNMKPLGGSYEWNDLAPELWPQLTARERTLYTHRVAPDYFRTVGIPLLQGRDLRLGDVDQKQKPAVLSHTAAAAYFPHQSPIGRILRIDKDESYQIVGVVADAVYTDLRDPHPSTVYLSGPGLQKEMGSYHLAIRAAADKQAVLSAVRALVRQTGKDVSLGPAVTLTEQIDQALLTERLIALLASFFAVLAVVLIAVGLYGVVGYTVSRRTSEIGLRLALGAARGNVHWMILREALSLSVVGIALGVPAVLLAGRLMTSLLYDVYPADPLTLSLAVLLILAVSVLAGWVPARKAARLDPLTALRYE